VTRPAEDHQVPPSGGARVPADFPASSPPEPVLFLWDSPRR